jgi:hypothetical protein
MEQQRDYSQNRGNSSTQAAPQRMEQQRGNSSREAAPQRMEQQRGNSSSRNENRRS